MRFKKTKTERGENNMENKCTLSEQQIETLARALVYMADAIMAYYDDPQKEAEYQRWYEERYGHPAPAWDRRPSNGQVC